MTNYDSLPEMNPEDAEMMRLFGRPEKLHVLEYFDLRETCELYQQAAKQVVEAGKPDGVNKHNMRFPNRHGVIPAIATIFPEGTADNARMRVYLSQPDADGNPPAHPDWSDESTFRHAMRVRGEPQWGTWEEEVWENRVDLEPVPVRDSHSERSAWRAARKAGQGFELQASIEADHATGSVSVDITAPLGLETKQSLIQQAIDSLGDRTGEDPHVIAWHLLLAGRERGIEAQTPTLLEIAQMMARGDEVKINMLPGAP